ncbi:MAG TPA: ABC transporter ATP-binding protein [Vicinamibacterales bacterium]|nr:ABC transporter ATP-binding protein [Vicinamibacterales bacterium]
MAAALESRDVRFSYGDREALRGVSFSVEPGEIFALLGPNGGGKTTLFRIAATLAVPAAGSVHVFGVDAAARPAEVRRRIGVVFQSPALDPFLTLDENLRHQGHLYGLSGAPLHARMTAALASVGLVERRRDLARTLSGGMQRRVEIAKALLHTPDLLLLDEPSTGLDPGARRDVWDRLTTLRGRVRTTVVLTTHLMDEAARCDRVGIIHEGTLVAVGPPDALIAEIGGDVIMVATPDPHGLAARIATRFRVVADVVEDRVHIERPRAHEFIAGLVEAFPGEIDAVSFGKPTLEDVFMHHTGRRLT